MNGKKIEFNENNYSKIFLSPYCFIQEMDDGFHIRKTDNNHSFVLTGEFVEHLLLRLVDGMNMEELVNYLKTYINDEAEPWIEMMISEGFLM